MDYSATDKESRMAARDVFDERQSQTAERGGDQKEGFSLHGKVVSPLFGIGAALSEWSQNLQMKMETTWPLVKEGMSIRYVKLIAGGVLASVAAIYLWKLYRRLSVDSGEEFCTHKDNIANGTSTSSKLSGSVLIEKRQVPRSATTRVSDMAASGVPVRSAPGDSNMCKSVAAGTPLQLGGEGYEDCPEGEAGGVDRYACSGPQQDPGAGDTGTGHSPQDDGMKRSSSMEADDQQTLSKTVAMATVSQNSLPTLLCSVQERRVMCVSAPATPELLRPCEVSTAAVPPGAPESVIQSSNKEENAPLSVSTTLWSTISTQPDLINSSASGMNRGSLTPTSPATTRTETLLDIQKNSSHIQAPPCLPTKGPIPVNVAIIDPDCNAVKCEGSASCLGVGLDVTQDLGRPQGPQPLAQVAYTAAGQTVGFHRLCAYASLQCATHPSPQPARSVGGSHLDSPQNSVLNLQQQQVLSDTPHVSRCQAESTTSSRSLAQCEASAACCSLCAQTLHVHSPSVHVYNLPAHARPHDSGRPAAAAAALQCPTFSTHLSHHYQHLHAATSQPPLLPHVHHSPSQRFSVAMPREEHCGSAAAAPAVRGPRPAPLQQYLHPNLFPAVSADALDCGAVHACRGSALESASDGLRTRLTERGLPADAVQQAVILWRPPRTGETSSAGSVPAGHGYATVVYPQSLLTGGHHFDTLRGSVLPPSSPSFFLHHQHPATPPFPPSATTDLYLDGYISYPAALGETFSSHAPYMVFREGSPQFFRY